MSSGPPSGLGTGSLTSEETSSQTWGILDIPFIQFYFILFNFLCIIPFETEAAADGTDVADVADVEEELPAAEGMVEKMKEDKVWKGEKWKIEKSENERKTLAEQIHGI